MLRQLIEKGVFEEPEPGRFAVNGAAEGLIQARLGLDLESFGSRMAPAWETLLSAVRTGKSAYREMFGRPFWGDLEAIRKSPPISTP